MKNAPTERKLGKSTSALYNVAAGAVLALITVLLADIYFSIAPTLEDTSWTAKDILIIIAFFGGLLGYFFSEINTALIHIGNAIIYHGDVIKEQNGGES